jgi:hypothetical protein
MGLLTFQQALALAYGKYKDPGTGITTTFTPPASLGNLINGKVFLQASAALPGSITIPAGASFSVSRSKEIQLPQTNANSLYFHGNPRIKAFFTDLLAGNDSVDFIFVGDSNINFNSYGYVQGFASVLNSSNVPIYSTPLYPCTSFGANDATASALNYELGIVNNLSRLSQLPAQLTAGSTTQYSEISSVWNRGYVSINEFPAWSNTTQYAVNQKVSYNSKAYICVQNTTVAAELPTNQSYWSELAFRYGGTGTDIDWIAAVGSNLASGYFSSIISVGVPSGPFPDEFGLGSSMNYRVGYATFPNSPNGRITPVAYTVAGGTVIRGEATFSTNRATNDPVYKVGVVPVTNTGNTNTITFNKYYYGSTSAKTNAPYGLLFESVCKPSTKGYAINFLVSAPGEQANRVVKQSLKDTQYTTTAIYLKEIRERQISCGGTGRVVVFVNVGVNGNESTTAWSTGITELTQALRNAWTYNGFPNNDLQFIVTATARTDAAYQSSTYTNQVGQHDAGVNLASKFFDIAFVHIYNGLDAAAMNTLWDGAGASSVHLNSNGYVTVAQLVWDQCRNVSAVKLLHLDGGDINHNGKWVQAEKNYHDTGTPYFYSFLKKR